VAAVTVLLTVCAVICLMSSWWGAFFAFNEAEDGEMPSAIRGVALMFIAGALALILIAVAW
jgi:hypothetical protein